MSVKSKITYAVFSILTVTILNLFPIFESGSALAFKPYSRRAAPHAVPRPGKVVARLPAAHIAVWAGGAKFFFHGGVFYRRGHSGFIVVHAPVGAILPSLPIGFSIIVMDGVTYCYLHGVYYQKAPSGYIVVNAPIPEQPQVASGNRVTVTAQLLNVRSGPGMQFPAIRQARQGDVLTVHGTAPGWLYVRLPEGTFGWVSETFTVPSASAAPSASG